MIKRNIWGVLLLSLFVSLSTVSCSSDDNSTDPKKEQEPEKDKDKDKDKEGETDTDQDGDKDKDKDSKVFYAHKVLLEDFTGTSCGPCARVINALEALENHTYTTPDNRTITSSSVITVGVHVNVPATDPFTVKASAYPLFDFYINKFSIDANGYFSPFAVVNGVADWDYPEIKNLDQPMKLVNKNSPIGIKISSIVQETSAMVTVNLAFSENQEGLNYGVYLVEDNISHPQAGKSNNYSHQAVLKATSTPVYGTEIPQNNLVEGGKFNPGSIILSYKKANIANTRVIVVIRNANGDVVNVQDAKANETKDFVVVE